jgi:hypothetical protein
MQNIIISKNAPLFHLCGWYMDKAEYQSSINEVNEEMYNLCSKYLFGTTDLTNKERETLETHFQSILK